MFCFRLGRDVVGDYPHRCDIRVNPCFFGTDRLEIRHLMSLLYLVPDIHVDIFSQGVVDGAVFVTGKCDGTVDLFGGDAFA